MLEPDDFQRLVALRSPVDPPAWELIVDDAGWRFAVRPDLPPMAYLTTIVLAPGGFVAAGLGLGHPWLVVLGVVFAAVATTVLVALRRREVRLGPYAEWDRASERLLLRRLDVELAREDLVGVQLLHAHRTDGQGHPGALISELHVIARGGEDEVLRYPLVAWNPSRPIEEVARRVATELDVPLRSRRFGRRAARAALGWPRGRGPYPSAAF